MYKLIKEKGHNATLTVINGTASVNIGRMTIETLNTLEKSGFKFGRGSDEINLTSKWELHITDETAKELLSKAMKIRKPDRSKKSEQADAPQEQTQEPVTTQQPVDVFDLIFGTNN